jgi:hypothetical protein
VDVQDDKADLSGRRLHCTVTRPAPGGGEDQNKTFSAAIKSAPIAIDGTFLDASYAVRYDPKTQRATLTAGEVSVTGQLATGQPLGAYHIDARSGDSQITIDCTASGVTPLIKPAAAPTKMVCTGGIGETDALDSLQDGFFYDVKTGVLRFDTGASTDAPSIPAGQGLAAKAAPLVLDAPADDFHGTMKMRCFAE